MLLIGNGPRAATGREPFLPPAPVTGGRAVAGIQHLSAGRGVRVARLLLDGGPGSLIVKYVDPEGAQASAFRERLYFDEEALNYRFLASLRERFDHAPRFLGRAGDAFYLEDLGPGEPRLPTGAAMVAAVAGALVSLHAATHDALDAYDRLRAELAYPPRPADLRALHAGSDDASFQTGSRMLLEWAAVLLPGRVRVIEETFENARRRLDEERDEHAFVHNDLVSARQCVLRGGRLHLIDFEHGRYGHRALELAKVLMGKLEISRAGKLAHVHPSVPAEVVHVYHAAWRARTGRPASDGEWRAQVAAALCFQAVAEIGQCLYRSDSDFLLGLGPTIRGFLERLDLHLRALDDGTPFHAALRELLPRMPVLPAPARVS